MEICKRIRKAPILGIHRHRLLSDGSGVRTLIGFYGCPLSCKYCLNPECHNAPENVCFRSVKDLLDEVKVDNLYFAATGGGITFGGGEPLLYADFIADFINKAPIGWKYSCETSLNVENSRLKTILRLIDEFIVDIKDLSPIIYKDYTGINIDCVLGNLKLIADLNFCHKLLIRIPQIPNYNSINDLSKSKEALKDMGFSRFDNLTYVTKVEQAKAEETAMQYNGINWGKVTCEVLKRIRVEVADHYGIPFSPNKCTEKICHTGTCPVCEQELEELTAVINRNNHYRN